MREIYIDLDAVMAAFEYSDIPIYHYLDLETGSVVMVTDETRYLLEAIYEEYWDPESDSDFDLEGALDKRGITDWRREALLEADAVEEHFKHRYIEIPNDEPGEGYRDMQNFIQTLDNDDLKNSLWAAINGQGAFRNFKSVLRKYRLEQAQWFTFQEEQLRQRILFWLEMEDIKPTNTFAALASGTPEPVRGKLIAEALKFTRLARNVAGVERIALIGSLATDKPHPNDVDILVTISEEADLETLASYARRMAGHAQSFNSGADVFLADSQGEYLGRTCPWRECTPHKHASCDALHCGERPYLHDDLNTIRLSTTLIARPPVELWPEIVVRVALPRDIETGLVTPLRLES